MTKLFPTLSASPYRLRQFKVTDIELIREVSADPLIPLVTTVPAIFSDDEGLAYIKRQWSRFEDNTGYSFAIADAKTDRAIGFIGLSLNTIKEGRASIGYWIAQSARGQGAISVALKEIVRWAQHDLKIPRLELNIEPWNTASIKAAETAGFEKEGVMRSWQNVGAERKDMIMMSNIL